MLLVAISLIGTHVSWDSVLFMGWFGPRGLASIVLAFIALKDWVLSPGKIHLFNSICYCIFQCGCTQCVTALPYPNYT